MSNYYIPNWWSHAPSAIKVREGDDEYSVSRSSARNDISFKSYVLPLLSHFASFPILTSEVRLIRGRDCQTGQNCIQFHSLWKYSLHVKQDFFFTTKWNWFISLLFYFSIQWLIMANKSNFARHFDVRKLYLPLLTQWKFVTK